MSEYFSSCYIVSSAHLPKEDIKSLVAQPWISFELWSSVHILLSLVCDWYFAWTQCSLWMHAIMLSSEKWNTFMLLSRWVRCLDLIYRVCLHLNGKLCSLTEMSCLVYGNRCWRAWWLSGLAVSKSVLGVCFREARPVLRPLVKFVSPFVYIDHDVSCQAFFNTTFLIECFFFF